jgi:outer membrane immunogenic protein
VKVIIVAGALLLGTASVASATDFASREQSPFNWSGSYTGIQIGYGWGRSNFIDNEYNGIPPFFPEVRWGVDSDGLLAGINAGHNWHRDNVVIGVEGEIGYLNLSGKKLQPGVDPYGDPYDASGTVGQGWYGGLSARLGYALDRTLLYTKAGAIYSGSTLGFVDTCTTAPCGNSTTNSSKKVGWGYQLGAGIEYAVTASWTLKAEYMFLDFGRSTISGIGMGGGFDGVAYHIHSDISMHTVKVGVNYHFN